MTTPERLRRRQMIEGVVLIVIGLIMVIQAWYFHGQDVGQQDCLESNFASLSKALDTRSNLTDQESQATRKVLLAFAKAAREVEAPAKEQAANRDKMIDALLDYDRVTQHVQQQRQENPLPPYPIGVCSEAQR